MSATPHPDGPPKGPPSPTDEAAGQAWDEIMAKARDHALIIGGYGGVVTLATPANQREAGLRDKVLRMHVMSEGGDGARG